MKQWLLTIMIGVSSVLCLAQSQPTVTELPIQGIKKLTYPNGHSVYVSLDGRFVFEGRIKDLWTGSDTVDIESFRKINWKGSAIAPKDIGILVPVADHSEIELFISPDCGVCFDLMQKLLEQRQFLRYSLRVILLSSTQEGAGINELLWCADEPLDSLSRFFMERDISNEIPNPTCNKLPLVFANAAAKSFGLNRLPAVVTETGNVITGDVQQLTTMLLGEINE